MVVSHPLHRSNLYKDLPLEIWSWAPSHDKIDFFYGKISSKIVVLVISTNFLLIRLNKSITQSLQNLRLPILIVSISQSIAYLHITYSSPIAHCSWSSSPWPPTGHNGAYLILVYPSKVTCMTGDFHGQWTL